jgi:thymidine kinase
MAKLIFNYSAMNAGKSTALLQASYNYHERGMRTMLMTAAIDNRYGQAVISSRLGISSQAFIFHESDDVLAMVSKEHHQNTISCVLIDEAQFLTKEHVWQISQIADQMNIPVLAYGLRTDFQGELFPGSAALLGIADHIREIRTICWCGRKAIMVLRLDADGQPIMAGEQIAVGGNDLYVSVCRRHWVSRDKGQHG